MGFEIGLFSTEVVNAVLVLILVSIVLGTLSARRFVRGVEPPPASHGALGERVALVVDVGDPSPVAVRAATRIARRSQGVVDAILVRRHDEGRADRASLLKLEELAVREGFDGRVHTAVDRSKARAVVHAAWDLDATLVVVETEDGDATSVGPGDWVDAAASAIPAPIVVLQGRGLSVRRTYVVTGGEVDVPEHARALAREVATLAGAGGSAEVVDGSSSSWAEELQAGDLAVVPVGSWELAAALPTPPDGAVVAALLAGPAPVIHDEHPIPQRGRGRRDVDEAEPERSHAEGGAAEPDDPPGPVEPE